MLVDYGIHILGIKDMAGLLKPRAARLLISSIRSQHPRLVIHVHTHDTSGNGVSSMLASVENGFDGADVIDLAIDALSGTTSQPCMGSVVAELSGTPRDTGIDFSQLQQLNAYWEQVALYF